MLNKKSDNNKMTKKYTPNGKGRGIHGKVSDFFADGYDPCEELIVYEIIDNEDNTISIKGQLNIYTKKGTFEKHIVIENLEKGD